MMYLKTDLGKYPKSWNMCIWRGRLETNGDENGRQKVKIGQLKMGRSLALRITFELK